MSEPKRVLSNEILKIIFLNLPKNANDTISKKTLSQCALTCSSWRLVAQSLIFHNLTLKNENDIEDINGMLLHNCMIEQWTRLLSIDFPISKSSILITIDKLLPRIEELSFSPAYYFNNSERQRIDLAYFFLYELLAKDNKFNNLRVLPTPATIKQHQLYVKCLHVIRNNITDIKIYDCTNENRLLYANLCNNLHIFPHLKSVCAIVENNMSLDVVEYCEFLLNKKNLSSVFLQELKIVIIRSSYSHSFTSIGQGNIFPASNIKSVFISIDYDSEYQYLEKLGDSLMIYIMKKFPNLYSFELVGDYMEVVDLNRIEGVLLLENEGPDRRINQSPGVVCQFLNYIFKTPNCCLKNFIISNEYTVQVIQELFTSSKGTINLNPTIPNYLYTEKIATTFEDYIWEVPSFITLDAKITPRYRKIGVNISALTDTAFRTQQLALVEQVGKYFDAVYLERIQPSSHIISI